MPPQVTYTFPSAAELMGVEQTLLPTLTQDNPAFSILPAVNKETPLLVWEQLDNFTGMQNARGLNGPPQLVNPVGSKQYTMQPGYYGEFMSLNETDMMLTRRFATINQAVDVSDLVTVRGNQLLHRQLKRQSWLIWQLLVNGYFSVTDPNGTLMHADSYQQRTFTATVPWSTVATATPLADFRSIRSLARGYSINLGAQAVAYANSTTVRNLLNNTNASDIGGKKLAAGATFNSLSDFNNVLGVNDCPRVVEWDGGWVDDSGNFNLDIPDGTVVVKGARTDGAPIGNFISTMNVNNPGFAAGPYYKVFQPQEAVPPTVEVHRGQNCGCALYFPSALIIMKV